MLRGWALVALVGCAASATTQTRTVVAAQAEFQAVEPAAQPVPVTPDPAPVEAPATPEAKPGALEGNGPIVVGLLDGEAALEEAWDRWSAGKTATYDAVFEIAVLANRSRPLPMADELMVIALVRAVELSACDPERLGRIRLLAIAVNTSAHTPELDADLTRLADTGPTECAQITRR